MRVFSVPVVLALLALLSACGPDSAAPVAPDALIVKSNDVVTQPTTSDIVGDLPKIAEIDSRLSANGVSARLNSIQLMVNSYYPPGAPTVYVVDRTRYLPSLFVAHDPRRRSIVGLEWTYDLRRGNAFTVVNGAEAPWTSAQSRMVARDNVATWTSLSCYKAFFDEVPYPLSPNNENIEFIDDFYLGGETQPFSPVAEITYGGFLPYTLFRQIFGPNGDNVLGVTFQFSFSINGQYTDIDHDGNRDGIWSEIYFNDYYYWGNEKAPGFDPSLVASLNAVGLHEAGHTFGLGHWGRTFENHGGLHYAGDNVMSEHYQPFVNVKGEPTSAFCGIYTNWH